MSLIGPTEKTSRLEPTSAIWSSADQICSERDFLALTQLGPAELTHGHGRRATGPQLEANRAPYDYRSQVRNKVLGSSLSQRAVRRAL
jgi:hypothetical protein